MNVGYIESIFSNLDKVQSGFDVPSCSTLYLAAASTLCAESFSGKVVGVTDGDTIEVMREGTQREGGKAMAAEFAFEPVADTLQALTEALTGIATSERKDLFLSLGYLLQRLRGQGFLGALHAEWKRLREKGRIRDDYAETEQCQACLQELLDCLDRDSPDGVEFGFIKRVFLAAARERKSDRESVLPQQYMRVSRGLTSGEILVLVAAYRLSKNPPESSTGSALEWLRQVAAESGLVHPSLAEIHEQSLMKKCLLTPRKWPDGSGISSGERYRLTSLAIGLCEFVLEEEDEEPGG